MPVTKSTSRRGRPPRGSKLRLKQENGGVAGKEHASLRGTLNNNGLRVVEPDANDAGESRNLGDGTNAFHIMMNSSVRSLKTCSVFDTALTEAPECDSTSNKKRTRSDVSPKIINDVLGNRPLTKRHKSAETQGVLQVIEIKSVEKHITNNPVRGRRKKKSRIGKRTDLRLSSADSTASSGADKQKNNAPILSSLTKRNNISDFFVKTHTPEKNNQARNCSVSTNDRKTISSIKNGHLKHNENIKIRNGERTRKRRRNTRNRRETKLMQGKRNVLQDKNFSNISTNSIEIINLDQSLDDTDIDKNNECSLDTPDDSSQTMSIFNARRNFLLSGIPEKMKIEKMQPEKIVEHLHMLFPSISHVGHHERVSCNDVFTDFNIKLLNNFSDVPHSEDQRRKIITNFRSLNICYSVSENIPMNHGSNQLPALKNRRDLIKHLKTTYEKFPTYRCYNQLKEKYRLFDAENPSVQRDILEDCVNVHSQFVEEDPKTHFSTINCDVLYTEKYKPTNSTEVLVNFTPVLKLKEFLSSWKNRRNRATEDSDVSDYSNSSCSDFCNFVVLLGPSSCGKTNAVYLLANEMNFKILEINAGMKRNGKKIIQELHEATQSHLVKRRDVRLSSKIFSKKCPQSLNKNDDSKDDKLCLILIEDADIIFEQDIGFVEAIMQLATTSKRPVILTASDTNCQHLSRLTVQNSIEFPNFNVLNVSKYLSVLSIVENCPVELDDIIKLYLYNAKNLRKTILELQFFIRSGGDGTNSEEHQCPVQTDNYDDVYLGNYVHKNLFKTFSHKNADYQALPLWSQCDILWLNMKNLFKNSKILNAQDDKNQIETLNKLSNFYENMSFTTSLCTYYDYNSTMHDNLREDIAHFLVEDSANNILQSSVDSYDLRLRQFQNSFISDLIQPRKIHERGASLDVEPILREICRSEQRRLSARRGSRFYHYLSNTVSCGRLSDDVFRENCKIFNETFPDRETNN